MAIKLAVIGANLANVEEIKNVVIGTVGDNIEIITATVDNYHEMANADLYICLINRKQEVESVFGREKVVALTLVPPTEYFLALHEIPANSYVVLFNNSTSGTVALTDRLKKYHLLNNCHCEVVPYDELSDEQVADKVAAADYIIGGMAYVCSGSVLHTKFSDYLSSNTTVLVSPQRIATSDSISHLCYVYSQLCHKRMTAELERLSATDFLTQIPNRRTFDRTLLMEWKCVQRTGQPLSLAMIDIDFFKDYNDHYGHIQGDECLKTLTNTLKRLMRCSNDFCARYGGEEFAVILPNTDGYGAEKILERIRSAIMSLNIKHEYSAVAPMVTVSIGIASTQLLYKNNSMREFLTRADHALYQAKNQGRNRVILNQ
jgi:diguanylate cyclase (GGDEF)-like protein